MSINDSSNDVDLLSELESSTESETYESIGYGDSVMLSPYEYITVSRIDVIMICMIMLVGLQLITFLQLRRLK